MTKTEKEKLAQELIVKHLSTIAYGDKYDEYANKFVNIDEAETILYEQLLKIGKLLKVKIYL